MLIVEVMGYTIPPAVLAAMVTKSAKNCGGDEGDDPGSVESESSPGTPDPDEPEFLKELKRVKTKSGRRRWVDSKGRIYEWDSRHGELEVYSKRGRHIGVRDPKTGKWIKQRVPGRRIEP